MAWYFQRPVIEHNIHDLTHLAICVACTYLPGDNKLVSSVINSADFFRISVRLLRRCGAYCRCELAAFTKSNRVTCLNTKREVSPRPKTNFGPRENSFHPRSFGEPVLLVKWRVVIDDVLCDSSIAVIAWRPHHYGHLCATPRQSDVVWRVWSTCVQTSCQCQQYSKLINSPNKFPVI